MLVEVCTKGQANERVSVQKAATCIKLYRWLYVYGTEADYWGGWHHDEKVILKDEQRQRNLEAAGFTVLRFSDHEVLKGMTGVIAYLEEWIEKYEASKTTP